MIKFRAPRGCATPEGLILDHSVGLLMVPFYVPQWKWSGMFSGVNRPAAADHRVGIAQLLSDVCALTTVVLVLISLIISAHCRHTLLKHSSSRGLILCVSF